MKLKHSWWGWTCIVFFEISISLVFIPHHLFNFIHQINHISYFVVFESCSNKWRLSTQNTLCIWCILENNQKAWCSVWTANPCVKEICFVHFSWFSKHWWNLQEVLRINKKSETIERFSYSFSSVYFVLVFGHLRTSVICTSYIILAFLTFHAFFLSWVSLTGGRFAFCQSVVSLESHSERCPPEYVQFSGDLFAEDVALLLHSHDMPHNSLPVHWKRVWGCWHPYCCTAESSAPAGPLVLVWDWPYYGSNKSCGGWFEYPYSVTCGSWVWREDKP